jgi:hypothetical protein
MRLSPSTDLAAILPKSVASCLSSAPPQLYNWDDKIGELVRGVAMARSLVLQDIAQTMPAPVRASEKKLSEFLSQERLNMHAVHQSFVCNALKRVGRRRLRKHNGKAIVIIDATSHAKIRSRGEISPMPCKGKVRLHNLPTDDTILVPGYQEIWAGLLLKDGSVLPIARRLWTENGPTCASMNLAEEGLMGEACVIVREIFELDVILVADSGYRRKDLLHCLKSADKIDFVIRIEGKLTVEVDGKKGLLDRLGLDWPKRAFIQWRDSGKRPLVSQIAARRLSVEDSDQEKFCFNVLCLTPTQEKIKPMFLATTLTTATAVDLIAIGRIYSWRWAIETFFWNFKEGLNARSWRVFSCWEAIDRILMAAHMAYLILALLALFCQEGKTAAMRQLLRRIEQILRERFARPPKFTLGRFFQLFAMDYHSPRPVGAVL